MTEDRRYLLTGRQKVIGIVMICIAFVLVSAFCLYKEKQTYSYEFKVKELELKEAYIEDGAVCSNAPSDDYIMSAGPMLLPSGGYTIEITYMSDGDNHAMVQGNNDCVFDIQLPATYGELQTVSDETRLILPHGTDKARIKFYHTDGDVLKITRIGIRSDHHLYRDYYAYMMLAGIGAFLVILLILFYNRLKISETGLIYTGMLFAALVIVSIPFLANGTYYEVDTQAHLKRIEAIFRGLKDGQFPVIIGPNYANQYGELTTLQPGLFLYIPALFRLLGVSVPAAYNIFMILVNIATAITCFICAERLFGSMRWGLVASTVYLVEPFRMYVMMHLGAGGGMGIALVFLPVLITGIHETMNDNGKGWKYLAIGLWGLFCSHVMGFSLSFIVMAVYILFHINKLKEQGVFTGLVKAAVFFMMLSAGTFLPFADFYFSDWNRSALAWTDFYHFPTEYVREICNIVALAILVVSYFVSRKNVQKNRFVKGIFVIGFITLLMSVPFFPWALFGKIAVVDKYLSMMQYPFRFHFFTTVCVAYVAAFAICSNLDSKNLYTKPVRYIIAAALVIGIIANYASFSRTKLFYEPVVGEINTLMEDYLPGGTLTEWYENDTGEFSDYDLVQAYSYSKAYTHIDCTYTSAAEGQYMEFPLFYYKGYHAFDQNGSELKVEKGERNRVRVYLTKSDAIQELCLRYKVKPMYTYSFVFSLVFGGIWLALNAFSYIRNRRHRVLRFD